MSLAAWSMLFFSGYVAVMIWLGTRGRRRIGGGDDFATARGGYGPLVLAIAFASTTASGATFLGLPGLAYTYGIPALWIGVIYPLAIYGGVAVSQRLVSRYGNRVGHRSIPEFLGDRFQSDALRVVAALLTLVLLFFLAAQLVAGLAMFEMLLGLDKAAALTITSVVLMLYVVLGGAHADIQTDAAQGALMLVIAGVIVAMFAVGTGLEGGAGEVLTRLKGIDPDMLALVDPDFPVAGSVWALCAMFAAYLPFGLLPHIGNKLWALRDERTRRRFVTSAFVIAVLFPTIALGGLLARAVLGDTLTGSDGAANAAIPALFIEVFPGWVAALLGTAILASIMSTADGLVISSSQVFANDIYRRTIAPRWHRHLASAEIDAYVLAISRWGTVFTMLVATALAWFTLHMNVVLLTWVGIGALIAALAGSLVLGLFWRGLTRAGAAAGFVTGAATFITLHADWLPAGSGGGLGWLIPWLKSQAPNPYACAALGEAVSILVAVAVSAVTPGLPRAHLEVVFEGRGGGGPD